MATQYPLSRAFGFMLGLGNFATLLDVIVGGNRRVLTAWCRVGGAPEEGQFYPVAFSLVLTTAGAALLFLRPRMGFGILAAGYLCFVLSIMVFLLRYAAPHALVDNAVPIALILALATWFFVVSYRDRKPA